MKASTLCFLVKNDQILLAMKKRGFGAGLWNGAGGKANDGEDIKTAALRELNEEIGIVGSGRDLEPMGILKFRSVNKELDWNVHVFFLKRWQGEMGSGLKRAKKVSRGNLFRAECHHDEQMPQRSRVRILTSTAGRPGIEHFQGQLVCPLAVVKKHQCGPITTAQRVE